MSREKQIKEMANDINKHCCSLAEQFCGETSCNACLTMFLYNAGYRKQSEGEWVDNHCTNCGMTPIGEETWTRHGETPPRFELFMSFCPNCGSKMKGGAE